MNIDSILINRIGIVLNFLAGFMLAPEIIGLQRLVKIEESIEKTSNQLVFHSRTQENRLKLFLRDSFGEYISTIKEYIKYTDDLPLLVFGALFAPLLVAPILYFVDSERYQFLETFVKVLGFVLLVFFVLFSILVARADRVNIIRAVFEVVHTLFLWLVFILLVSPILMLVILGVIIALPFRFLLFALVSVLVFILWVISFVMLALLKSLQFFLKIIIEQLQGSERLRAIMVSLGIVIFIVDNLLQFIATF